MPAKIPYNGSLVLGDVVSAEQIEALRKMADAQATVDGARNRLDQLMRQKLSLDMTLQELRSMGLETSEIEEELAGLIPDIQTAARDLAGKVIASEEAIDAVKSGSDE